MEIYKILYPSKCLSDKNSATQWPQNQESWEKYKKKEKNSPTKLKKSGVKKKVWVKKKNIKKVEKKWWKKKAG